MTDFMSEIPKKDGKKWTKKQLEARKKKLLKKMQPGFEIKEWNWNKKEWSSESA